MNMKKKQDDNYFKGFRKSPKQLLDSLKKYLKDVVTNIYGYSDTCEYHLEQENCKSSDDYADVQCICEEINNHLGYVIDVLEEDGLQADVSPDKLYNSEDNEDTE